MTETFTITCRIPNESVRKAFYRLLDDMDRIGKKNFDELQKKYGAELKADALQMESDAKVLANYMNKLY